MQRAELSLSACLHVLLGAPISIEWVPHTLMPLHCRCSAKSAITVQRAWRNRVGRLHTWASMRSWLELLADPYSDDLYYLDVERNVSFPFPLRMFGNVFLLHPLPDWKVQVVYHADGTWRLGPYPLSTTALRLHCICAAARLFILIWSCELSRCWPARSKTFRYTHLKFALARRANNSVPTSTPSSLATRPGTRRLYTRHTHTHSSSSAPSLFIRFVVLQAPCRIRTPAWRCPRTITSLSWRHSGDARRWR